MAQIAALLIVKPRNRHDIFAWPEVLPVFGGVLDDFTLNGAFVEEVVLGSCPII